MRNSIIVAMDQNYGVGYQNRLPWRLPADARFFKNCTMSHHLIVGRKTYESIGRPLPGRIMIVVTRNPRYQAEGCLVAHSLAAALAIAEANGENETFIGGGTEIYKEALPNTDRLYITHIQAEFLVDTYFPYFDLSEWIEFSADFHPSDGENPFPFTIVTYDLEFAQP
jgi:dihydrofolate reductase